jgi:hypothetical protein
MQDDIDANCLVIVSLVYDELLTIRYAYSTSIR